MIAVDGWAYENGFAFQFFVRIDMGDEADGPEFSWFHFTGQEAGVGDVEVVFFKDH